MSQTQEIESSQDPIQPQETTPLENDLLVFDRDVRTFEHPKEDTKRSFKLQAKQTYQVTNQTRDIEGKDWFQLGPKNNKNLRSSWVPLFRNKNTEEALCALIPKKEEWAQDPHQADFVVEINNKRNNAKCGGENLDYSGCGGPFDRSGKEELRIGVKQNKIFDGKQKKYWKFYHPQCFKKKHKPYN